MRHPNLIVLGIFAILVAVILALSPRTLKSAQGFVLQTVTPFLSTGSSLQKQLSSLTQQLQTLQQLEVENGQLQIKNRELNTQMQLLRGLQEENRQLREALDYRQRSVFELLPARVIGRDASTWWNTLEINRGENDGVEVDLPVLTERGLVGKIVSTTPGSARVLLVTDESCRVAAYIEGTGEKGIAAGERVQSGAAPELKLDYLSKHADLNPGQKVYTAGVGGGVFPSGVLLGTVREIRARSLDAQASVVPAVDLSSIENVFVVKGVKSQ